MSADVGECALIIFDCDGVLVDSELLSARAYGDLLAGLGVEMPPGVMEGCFGLKQADIFARVEAAIGRPIEAEDKARLWPRTQALFKAELKPTPGLLDFLERLDVARCVASSSHDERIRFSLDVTGLRSYFGDSIFSTQLVRRGKPAPDIFLHAAQTMGVAPERCVVIEDSIPGVQGAVAAGMRAVGFLGGRHINPEHEAKLRRAGATFVSETWLDIEQWLASRSRVRL